MNKYNPHIHHRRSIRLKGYDYAQAGLYFVTICVQHRECLFGKIGRGEPTCSPEMELNDAGKMIVKWYYELENKFPDIKCDEMMVMPNHFHCIVENVGTVGADPRLCPINDIANDGKTNADGNTTIANDGNFLGEHNQTILGEHIGSPLHRVVQWFKTMTTNEYIHGVKNLGWQPFDGKLWQRNYYEHIIRDEQSYQTISNYIINNPAKWAEDKFYSNNV